MMQAVMVYAPAQGGAQFSLSDHAPVSPVVSIFADRAHLRADMRSDAEAFLAPLAQGERPVLVGHSMGGLIIRSALPRLEKYKKHFHSLITLSSPHLGYSYSSSKLVDVGLWFMNAVKKCTSIKEMNMCDHEEF